MITVWKFDVEFRDYPEIEMPKDAEILYFEEQFDSLKIWALVDTDAEKEIRRFRLAGTGHPIGELELNYVGTIKVSGGRLVWHLFEIFGKEDGVL